MYVWADDSNWERNKSRKTKTYQCLRLSKSVVYECNIHVWVKNFIKKHILHEITIFIPHTNMKYQPAEKGTHDAIYR